MEKVINIPENTYRVNLLYRFRIKFWMYRFMVCAHYHPPLEKEIKSWPEGFTVIFKTGDRYKTGFHKSVSGLNIIREPQLYHYDVLLHFKDAEFFNLTLSGKKSIREAYTEGRFILKGNAELGLSFIRAFYTAQMLFLPGRYQSNVPRNRRLKGLNRIKVLLGILNLGICRREGAPCDS